MCRVDHKHENGPNQGSYVPDTMIALSRLVYFWKGEFDHKLRSMQNIFTRWVCTVCIRQFGTLDYNSCVLRLTKENGTTGGSRYSATLG